MLSVKTGQTAIPVYIENFVGDSVLIPDVNHSAVSIASVSTLALASNPDRKYALFINDSDEVIYLKIGAVAITGAGIRLNANGGSFEMGVSFGNLFLGDINAVCASGGKNLLITEG